MTQKFQVEQMLMALIPVGNTVGQKAIVEAIKNGLISINL
jgi:hypothetical protein